MSILSGFFKTKKYRKTDSGYKLQSEWTSSQTVQMDDGNTLEENLGAVKGITSSLSSTSSNYALSASAGKSLNDSIKANTSSISTLNTNLTNVKSTAESAVAVGANSLTFSSGTIFSPLGSASVNKAGKIAFIHTIFKLNSAISQNNLIAVVPSGYAPTVDYGNVGIFQKGTNNVKSIKISADGSIRVASSTMDAGIYELSFAYAIK